MGKTKISEMDGKVLGTVERLGDGKVENKMIAAIERIVGVAVECKLGGDVYVKADSELVFLAEKLGITRPQALLFALFMEFYNMDIEVCDLARLIDCRNVRILSLLSEDRALIEKKLVRVKRDGDEMTYRIHTRVVQAIKNNEPIGKKREKLDINGFFEALGQIMEESESDNGSFVRDVCELVSDNMHLEFCRVYRKYFSGQVYDGLLFMIFAYRLVNLDDDYIGEHNWRLFFSGLRVRCIRKELSEKTSYLLKKNILEEAGHDGIRDNCYYRISDAAKEEFFVELEGLNFINKKVKGMMSYKDIVKKNLFYNEREGGQIVQLSSLISIGKFNKIQKRLEETGMRKGFACLFYGAPGTGKTETVYQLARKTKRDLFVIDVAKIKSCWVGESEKNMSEAFRKYNACVEKSRKIGGNIPILLFNEADAVLGIRNEGATRAVEKMENSIQNIILQEMERLEGIMIATTNLATNLDKAFERRFIYKIEFGKPSLEAKCSIWRSMIPHLGMEAARKLAGDYDFSGGQIENIARKRAVEMVLTGKEPSLEQIDAYCKQESLNTGKRAKIGF